MLFGKQSDSQPVVPTTDESAGDDLCTSEPSLELPKKFFPKRSKAAACRALLNQIASLTYLVVDDASLSRLLDALINMKEDVSSSIPEEERIHLEPVLLRTQHSKFTPITQCSPPANIPLRQSRKKPSNGRVGAAAARKRKSEVISVEEIKAPDCEVEETQNILEMYVLPDHLKDYCSSPKEEVVTQQSESDSIEPSDHHLHFESEADGKIETDNVQPKEQSSEVFDDHPQLDSEPEEDIEILNVIPRDPLSDKRICRRRKVNYTLLQQEEILDGHMLTDMTINLAQNMLFNQFPCIQGFEDTGVGRVFNFSKHSGKDPYIQIIHTGSLHWVCFSNANRHQELQRNDVDVYDSLNSRGNINFLIKSQIADFLYCGDFQELHAYMQPVQQQSNGTNCGLFAIAYATALAYSRDPTKVYFDEEKMRIHLHECIVNGKITPFPEVKFSFRIKMSKAKKKTVELWCTCKRPFQPGESEAMAECETCMEWFHKSCKDIPDGVFKQNEPWNCKRCK